MAKSKQTSVAAEAAPPATKFLVSSAALLRVLTPLAAVIPGNPVVPVLADVHLALRAGGLLTCTASDLEVTLTSELPVEARGELTACVPAKKLVELLKALPDQPVTFTLDEHARTITLTSVNGTYTLPLGHAASYPRTPVLDAEPLELPAAVLRQAARYCIAISGDELRPAMTGVLLELEATRLGFICTDGHRLCLYRRTDLGAGGPPRQLIMPGKAWRLLASKLPADAELVSLVYNEHHLRLSWPGAALTARLIDERYPDYVNVIPVSNPNHLVMNRAELLAGVRRCALLANSQTHQLRLAPADNRLALSAENYDAQSRAQETLTCQYDGEALEIGFNARFLTELLGCLSGDEVRLELSTPNRAGLFKPTAPDAHEEVLLLAMPVLLNDYM